jgi:carbon monoxide dehydrogenase subunit G
MDLTGDYRIPAPRQAVWEALNDPETLKAAIAGCDELNRTGPNSFEAKVTAKVGPVKAKFGGKVHLEDLDPPNGYRIVGEGSGGAAGFAKGGAKVDLVEDGDGTILRYDAKADVGGKLAQIGSRLIQGTAKKMADDFFGRFSQLVATRSGEAPAGLAAAPVAASTAPLAAASVGGPVIETPASPVPAEPLTLEPFRNEPAASQPAATAHATPAQAAGLPSREELDSMEAAQRGVPDRPVDVPPESLAPIHGSGMTAAAAVHGATVEETPVGYEPGRITQAPVTAPPGPVPGVPEPVAAADPEDPAVRPAPDGSGADLSAGTPPPVGPASSGTSRVKTFPSSPPTGSVTPSAPAPAKGGLPWKWIIIAIVVVLALMFLLD